MCVCACELAVLSSFSGEQYFMAQIPKQFVYPVVGGYLYCFQCGTIMSKSQYTFVSRLLGDYRDHSLSYISKSMIVASCDVCLSL